VSARPRQALAAAIAAAALLAAGCGGGGDPPAPAPSGEPIAVAGGVATPYGRGAGRVWLLTPDGGPARSTVVYLHGWGARLPFEWHLAWLEHLLERGSAVVFPEFQDGVDDAWIVAPYDLRDGLQLGFRALDDADVPVVAAGFSVGATLAFVYAANAAAWGLPGPTALYAIFPVDPFQIDPALDLSGVHDIRTILLVGDRDDIAGSVGADALAAQLTALPRALLEYRTVHTTDRLLADHEAPTYVTDPDVRATFWPPLDRLIDGARRGEG
jgi:predicted esterase